MAARKNPFSRIRLVYRRSSTLVKCVVLAAIVLSTVALITLRFALLDTQAKADDLRQQAAALEQDNHRLEQSIAELGTVQGVKRVAIEKLGLVDPNTSFFTPTENSED